MHLSYLPDSLVGMPQYLHRLITTALASMLFDWDKVTSVPYPGEESIPGLKDIGEQVFGYRPWFLIERRWEPDEPVAVVVVVVILGTKLL